ncbi:hypothetical protein FZI91_06250 [Mycobacterium sp. CBMA271]|uniref:hypothetical protein n=1 Tax=unclassified Mycobacteroides TaxID=2618759 RepID=UPI0012DCEDC9|nr:MULTISPECIES: hypothetical protein [unclassified Mycobacteroides]MUM15406.1 hypothetical protein [Mycobacteroides sp. CBMA 326]MUM21307.1 hypothetical protein [Mycobacteroides sp. CBMA 271]
MTQRRVHVAVLVFAAVVMTTAVTACSMSDFVGGAVERTTYPPVTPIPPPPPGASILPADFPRDIPVVRGTYRQDGAGDSRTLAVSGVDASAVAAAGKLLTDAGFEHQSVMGQDAYLSSKYTVMVVGDDLGGTFTLRYTVMPMTGVPSMPSMTFPPMI